MNRPIKFSIITATWNCADTLKSCFVSFSSQSYVNREHIIVDGVSTDGTLEIINKYIDQVAVFISERDQGIYDALNKGIHLATGDVIGFLHADDCYASDDVLCKIAMKFEDPTVCAVYGDLEYVSRQDVSKVIRFWRGKPFIKQDLGWGWMPAHPTLYVRSEWYKKIGGFDISFKIAADYLSVLMLFSQLNFKAIYLPCTIVKMRVGGVSNKSLSSIAKKTMEDWCVLRSCGFSLFKTFRAIAWKNVRKVSQFTFNFLQ